LYYKEECTKVPPNSDQHKKQRLGRRILYDRYQEALHDAFGLTPKREMIGKTEFTPEELQEINWDQKEAENQVIERVFSKKMEFETPSFSKAFALIDREPRLLEFPLDKRYIESDFVRKHAEAFFGLNILFAAARFGIFSIVVRLLQLGAKATSLDRHGYNPEYYVPHNNERTRNLLVYYQESKKLIEWAFSVKHWQVIELRVLGVDNLRLRTIPPEASDSWLYLRIKCPGSKDYEANSNLIPFAAKADWASVKPTQFRITHKIKFPSPEDNLIISIHMVNSSGKDTALSSMSIPRNDFFDIVGRRSRQFNTVRSFPFHSTDALNNGAHIRLEFKGLSYDKNYESELRETIAKEFKNLKKKNFYLAFKRFKTICRCNL